MEQNNNIKDRQAISTFYDGFKKQQAATGVNLRHFIVFNECMRAGLKKDHKVLEIGCGIGTFTGLLARFIKGGNIVATDISSESIELAAKILKASPKVKLVVSDMTDFSSEKKFDFVVMVDVLEHIPFEQYDQLFSTIQANTHENSILAINIPHPDMIRFLKKNHPEKLQIIDNSVDMDFLSTHIYKNGFTLTGYKPYSIHNDGNDYVFMTFEKHDKYKAFQDISKFNIRLRKLIFRIKYVTSLIFAK
jgi:trans-aconitate 2-methyltransferase